MRKHTLIVTAVAAILLSTLATAQNNSAQARDDEPGTASAATYAIDIPPGPLTDTLKALGRQTHTNILYNPALVEGHTTPALRTQTTLTDALNTILKNTKLTHQALTSDTVVLKTINTRTSDNPRPAAEGSAAQRNVREGELRLAQVEGQKSSKETPVGVSKNEQSESAGQDSDKSQGALNEVVITGTHIRGVAPVGSQLIVIDREQIQASGYGRVQELLEELPQNFTGSASEEGLNTDAGVANFTRGQAIDLRGLGASSTLVLINGRRQPSGGTEGSFVDISSIATSAVERIEILTDGASALYGSDAIGGVVNFVLRKSYEGFETDVHVATNDGAAEELRVSQLAGRSWAAGNVLVGYQYLSRDELMRGDTPYGSKNGDFRALGGGDFRFPGGNPGTILDPNTFAPAYAIPANQDGRNLTAADLIAGQANYRDLLRGPPWLPEQTQHSAFFTFSQALTDRFEIFAEGRYNQRKTELRAADTPIDVFVPSSNPFYVDPFSTGFVIVSYGIEELGGSIQLGDTETYAFTAGGAARLGRKWQLDVAATYGREKNEWQQLNQVDFDRVDAALADTNPATALNVFGDGAVNNPATIDFIRSTDLRRGTSTVSSLTAVADGPLFELPASTVRLAVGLDYRDERLDANGGRLAPATGIFTPFATRFVGNEDRQVAAAFGELVVPVLGEGNGVPGARRLEFALAARYENYSDFGSTLNPKIGVTFAPMADLVFHGSWGTSFHAPRFNQLSVTANPPGGAIGFGIPDPQSSTGFSNVLFLNGANPDLHEETADTWTAGLTITPTRLPGLSFLASYFSIAYEGKIQVGGAFDNTLLLESQWAEIITRDPTQAQIDAVCDSPGFQGICPANVAAIIDTRLRNLAGVRVRGVDFDFRYRMPASIGGFNFGLAGTRMLTYERATSSTAPFFDNLDTVDNPLALRLQGTVGWDFRHWHVNAVLNYADDYRDATNRRVGSWTTLNASASYRFEHGGWLEGTRLQLSAINVFDEEPPFVNQFTGFDSANATQVGRSIALGLTKSW